MTAPPASAEFAATRATTAGLVLVAGLCVLGFWLGVAEQPKAAWTAFLVNFLFWSGLSIAGVVFAALLELTNARWAGPVRGVAESFAAFLPVSFLLYLLLLAGAEALYGWMRDPPQTRQAWFDPTSFRLRDTAAVLLLYGLCGAFVRASRGRATEGRHTARVPALAVVLVIVYAFAFSLLAIDLVMSLEPTWTSTLFPGYFFIGNLYAGIAAVTIACAIRRWSTGIESWLDEPRAHDLGKLLFGFALLWTYLFWSQFLAIWYGNLPEELSFLMARTTPAWRPLAVTVLALCFAVPFVALLSRDAKRPRPLVIICVIVATGVWLERFLLVAPAVAASPAFHWIDAVVSVGFLALFALSQVAPVERPRA